MLAPRVACTHFKRARVLMQTRDGDIEAFYRSLTIQLIVTKPYGKHSRYGRAAHEIRRSGMEPSSEWPDASPESLLPHERGQILHLVGTVDGARRFASAVAIPPADWLCVFDPAVRYSRPQRLKDVVAGPVIDPFELYGLDSDPRPAPIDADDFRAKRSIPEGVQNPLLLTRLDRQDPGPNSMPAISGYWALNVPQLTDRSQHLGTWISKVAHQPAAVWWASGKRGLHPVIQQMIHFQLGRTGQPSSPEVRRAWRLLSEAWETKQDDANTPWFELRASIGLDGWSPAAARQLALTHRPYLSVRRPLSGSPKPPAPADATLDDMMIFDVEYPRLDIDVGIPDSIVLGVTREFHRNLDHAVALETETGGYGLSQFAPIEADPTLEGSAVHRDIGLSACVLFYRDLFARLVAQNPTAARQEYDSWHLEDDTVFARLRIWASADNRVLTSAEAGELLSRLPDSVFWGPAHQRDLLITLKKRWASLPPETTATIERRLLGGPQAASGDDVEVAQRRAWFSLNRLHWLRSQGCQFSFDFEIESSRLRAQAPTWQPAHAERAARSMESQSGFVRTETAFDELLSVPIEYLLIRAAELSGYSREGFVQGDPFAGLVAVRPIRAFNALICSAKRHDNPIWAWTTFLAPQFRVKDKPRLACALAWRLSRLPANAIGELTHAISSWLQAASVTLAAHCTPALEAIWSSLISALETTPGTAHSSVVRRNDRDPEWVTEALNAPVGKLTQVLMQDPRVTGLEPNNEIPPSWLRSLELLLSLKAPGRQHALAILARNLSWLDAQTPLWTQQHLLTTLKTDALDRGAVWAGFIWGGQTPAKSLYEKLKANMMALIENHVVTRHEHVGFLAAMLLDGWNRLDGRFAPQLINDSEMREMLLKGGDDFRAQAVWHLERWSSGGQQGNEAWVRLLPELLRDVWPRHKAAKSPKTSARLCDLAFSNPQMFPRISELVTDLVTKVSDQHLVLTNLQDEESVIVNEYPKRVLALLSAILPDDVAKWPYRIEGILQRLERAEPSLIKDDLLIELKRKWNAR